jgi:hypothetical protein
MRAKTLFSIGCALWLLFPCTVSAAGGDLPSTPYTVRIDGDPREAFLLGAMALPEFDAISGNRDGSVRAYALATEEGLYVALLSTELPGAHLLTVPSPAAQVPAAGPPAPPPSKPPGGTKRDFLGPPVRIGTASAAGSSRAAGAPRTEEAPSAQASPDGRHPEFLGPPVREGGASSNDVAPVAGQGAPSVHRPPRGQASGWRTTPDPALAGDWMAVRVQGPLSVLFLLTPSGATVSVGENGAVSPLSDLGWMAACSTFGHTWAGEWLLPWKMLGLPPGASFRLSALRGRKLVAQGSALEVLSTSSHAQSGGRWGGDGVTLSAPRSFPRPVSAPRALKPYEAAPFVQPSEAVAACEDAAPAGEVVTAWLELPASRTPLSVRMEEATGDTEVFLVDFWWQAGTREEQDALFPARVAAGAGDLLVAERLLPQPAAGFEPSPWPTRAYLRMKIPKNAPAGILERRIAVYDGGRQVASLPWRLRLAPPLPPARRMAGAYYSETRPERWAADFADMARHGLVAVSCPARDVSSASRFVGLARAAGLEGDYFLEPAGDTPAGGWAYVTDEPSTAADVRAARDRALRLHRMGYRTWGALAWPASLDLARDMDGAAFAPNLLEPAGREGLSKGRWVYFQGLREDPLANRVAAGLLSFAQGLSGFWVFCYASGAEVETDWTHPFLRHDALVENGPGGARVPTVEYEALREGILNARLREALGPRVSAVDARFPQVAEVLEGRDWSLARAGWDPAAYRAALVGAWGGTP